MTGENGPRARRAPDAEGTRVALLAAARELFASHGFDRTTVRAIAERAGVNQALLFRYFGGKDALFAAVLAQEASELLATDPPQELLAATLRRMLDGEASDNPLYAALRSPGHDTALSTLRDELAGPYRAAFVARAAGPDGPDAGDAELRADLLLAWLLGIGFARSVLGVSSLVTADTETAVAHMERAARALLHPPAGDSGVSGV